MNADRRGYFFNRNRVAMEKAENMKKLRSEFDILTEQIIGGAYAVSNSLGIGFLEKVYENAMVVELKRRGLRIDQQNTYKVKYKDVVVGNYVADMIINGLIVVEIKAVNELDKSHVAQCVNYLKASNLKLAILLNFGQSKVQVKRVALGF